MNTIHHIAVICSDKDAALDFYASKLGFPVIRENYRTERDDWKIDLRINDSTELEGKGISCEPASKDSFTGEKMTFFRDPDGLPIEIHE